MAPGMIEKILSFLSLGANNKRNRVPNSQKRRDREGFRFPPGGCTNVALPINPRHFNGTVPKDTSITQDAPPAYTDILNDNTEDAVTIDHPDEDVQICPHEILSFERRQRLINLPRSRYNMAKIDALTPESEFHHRGHDSKTKECQDSCKPLGTIEYPGFVGSLKGFGTYSFRPPYAGRAGGLLLSFHWEMECLDRKRVTYSTTTELQEFFKTTGISLCPHIMLDDMDIVNIVHPVINRNGKPADPIDRYLAKEGVKSCTICPTEIGVRLKTDEKQRKTCRIDAKRWLGEGSGRDEQWRSQCVKQS